MATSKKATVKKTTAKDTSAKKVAAKRTLEPKHIGLVKHDPYLEPFEDAIRGRHEHALWKIG